MRIIWHLALYLSFSFLVPGIAGVRNRKNVDKDFGSRIVSAKEEILEAEETHRVERQAPFNSGPTTVPVVPVVEQHIHHHHIDHVVSHEEEVPEIDVWDIRDSVPGTPNEDYPVLRSIPKTNFTCEDRISGYYADKDTKCQVFHRCSEHEESARKRMDSFLCLNGTTFNQEILSCDWWENVRCQNANEYYGVNQELNMRGDDGKYVQLSAKRAAVAKQEKPLSPGIIPKNERVPLPPQFRSPLNRIQATEGPPLDEDEANALVEEAEEELEEVPEIEEVQYEPTTTRRPKTLEEEEEDEDIAYFFTPEQIINIRTSQDFGEKLKSSRSSNNLPAPRSKPEFRKETPEEKTPTPSSATTTTTVSFKLETSTANETNTYPLYKRAEFNTSTTLTPSTSSLPPATLTTTSSSSPTTPTPSTPSLESTYRIPVYRSARMKTKTESLFEGNRRENKEQEEDLFENKLKERPLSSSSKENDIQTETTTKIPRRVRRLRKIRKQVTLKPRKEKAAVYPGGLPYPSEQQLVFPNGTKKLLKFKHLIHTDVTESFPPYYSGARPPIGQHGYPYNGLNSYNYPYQNGGLGQYPYQSGANNGIYPQGGAYNGLYPQGGSYSGLYPQGGAYNGLYPQGSAYNGLYPQGGAYNAVHPQGGAYSRLYPQGGAYSGTFQNGAYNGLYQNNGYNGMYQVSPFGGLYPQDGAYNGLGTNPYSLGQYAYTNGIYPYQNALGYQGDLSYSGLGGAGASFPFQFSHPSLTYEHHHHQKEGTFHRALEPHHVFPAHLGAIPQKSLPPHHVIPAYYHALPVHTAEPVNPAGPVSSVGPIISSGPVNNAGQATSAEPPKTESPEGGMHLVRSHHALAAVPLTVNLGDRFAHHHHGIVPENPIAAHHYAAESHLAVAAFHHLVEPHPVIPVPVPVPAYTHGLPTVYSHGAPTPPSTLTPPQSSTQSRSAEEVHPVNAPAQSFPLTDILGMLGSP